MNTGGVKEHTTENTIHLIQPSISMSRNHIYQIVLQKVQLKISPLPHSPIFTKQRKSEGIWRIMATKEVKDRLTRVSRVNNRTTTPSLINDKQSLTLSK